MENKAKHRLLIVDDDPVTCTMLKDFFESEGYVADTAHDAAEAFDRLSQNYDAILSDIMMPKVSGIELLQQVRTRNPEARGDSQIASTPRDAI